MKLVSKCDIGVLERLWLHGWFRISSVLSADAVESAAELVPRAPVEERAGPEARRSEGARVGRSEQLCVQRRVPRN